MFLYKRKGPPLSDKLETIFAFTYTITETIFIMYYYVPITTEIMKNYPCNVHEHAGETIYKEKILN